jgi:hypothetical protein
VDGFQGCLLYIASPVNCLCGSFSVGPGTARVLYRSQRSRTAIIKYSLSSRHEFVFLARAGIRELVTLPPTATGSGTLKHILVFMGSMCSYRYFDPV